MIFGIRINLEYAGIEIYVFIYLPLKTRFLECFDIKQRFFI